MFFPSPYLLLPNPLNLYGKTGLGRGHGATAIELRNLKTHRLKTLSASSPSDGGDGKRGGPSFVRFLLSPALSSLVSREEREHSTAVSVRR
jgi:hypothetical protein